MPIANTCSIGYPHDSRADNAAYRHDRRADYAAYRHDRRADSLSQNAMHTNRWDPVSNYPVSKEGVPCRHQYLKYYSSDFHDLGIIIKLKL